MAAILLIFRPQPGADASAARARKMGLEAVVAPLFRIVPTQWEAPDRGSVDAVMLTSANVARHAGQQLKLFIDLPCYAVGEATAAAAAGAGFGNVRTGPADAAALMALIAKDGVSRALHLCGRDNMPAEHPQVQVTRRIVYAADAVRRLPPEAASVIEKGALALLHSPRAAALFARLVDEAEIERGRIGIAAISKAALTAAGPSWRLSASAKTPRDEALLELASKLCKSGSA